MKTKQIKLSEIVIDAGTQQRETISVEIVAEYAESIKCGAKFPPVVVFSDGVNYYLVDGFHRRHAYAALEIPAIDAEVHDGTVRDAILFSAGVNCAHGIRPTNADKRKSVLILLRDKEWSEWSDRQIAKHCSVDHKFVGKLRKIQGGDIPTLPPKPALNRDDDQKLSTEKKLSTEAEDENYDPKEHELQEAHETINHLADENQKLRDALSTGQLPETEIVSAEQTIIDLRKQIRALEAELDAVKSNRDHYMRENASLKKQCEIQRKKLAKIGSGDA